MRKTLITMGMLAASAVSIASQAEKPLNVVLICVDDLGWRDVGFMGSKFYETPNIDKLAAKGAVFTNAYASCSVCSPTRASILTGKYPARLGLTDWIHFRDKQAGECAKSGKQPEKYVKNKKSGLWCPPNPYWMNSEEVTLAELLKQKGYVTGHVGKWHLGPDKWLPEGQGFDVNKGGCDFGQPPSYFDPYYRNAERPAIPTLKPEGKGEYLTERENREAIKFITENRDKPFFLNMWHYAVHTPIQAKKVDIEYFKSKPVTDKQKNVKYAGMIKSVDEAVGKLLACLKNLGLENNTIVIFTSDNGGLNWVTNNEPLRAGKGYPYEAGIRIPQIVYYPGVTTKGIKVKEPVSSIDLLPTITEALCVKNPKNIDGVSLLPLLKGNSIKNRDLFWHFPHYRGKIAPYSIIRSGDYKLLKRFDGKEFELYNLREDIGEANDLSESNPKLVKRLNKKLKKWYKRVGAKLPERR